MYNVKFCSASIHIKKVRNNANCYFDESYSPKLLALPLIK